MSRYIRPIPIRSVLQDATPVALSYVPFAILYGALAEEAGLTLWETLAMSALVYSGATQLVAVQMIAAGASFAGIFAAASVLTVRHVMMGASMAPFTGRLPQAAKLALSPLMTDESFALAWRKYREDPHAHGFFLGTNLYLYLTWNSASAVGHVGKEVLPALNAIGLNLIFPLLFLAILVGMITTRAEWIAALFAVLFALGARVFLPGEWVIPLAGLACAAVGVAAERRQEKPGGETP